MSFFFEKPDVSALDPRISPAAPTGFGENFMASWRAARAADLSASSDLNLAEAYGPIVEAMTAGRPAADRFVNPYRRGGAMYYDPSGRARRAAGELEAEIWETLTSARAADPAAFPDLPRDRADFDGRVRRTVQSRQAEAAQTSAAATAGGVAGQLLGSVAAVALDPPILMSLPLGAPAGSPFWRAILLEGLAAGATETVLQPGIQAYRAEQGLEAGVGLGAANVGLAAVGGAAFSGVLRGAVKGGKALLDLSPRRLVEEFDAAVPDPTPAQRAAREVLLTEADVAEANPLPVGRAGAAEHRERLAESLAAAEEGRPSPLPDAPASPRAPPARLATGENLDGLIWSFDPAELEVDAKLFQFKEGGDEVGMTDRLVGVTEWDPVKAGQVLVYEFADGRRFIADGHQRLALAKRLAGERPDSRVALYGHLLREADGVSPEQARAIAAMKNVAEGTGTAIDAAKVLRVDPGRLGGLPPRSELVRQARDLVNLSDDAFGMVVNELVPAHFAAIVGRLVREPGLQKAVLAILAKAEPENAVQAEAIVRQALEAGSRTETQIGLFGEETIVQSLYGERAKVLDRAMKLLRRDHAVFATLVNNADLAEAAGNRLAGEANLRRARNDAAALATLQVLANRKGPLSDALSDAARRAADSGNFAAAAREFAAAVRDAAQRGDLDGLAAGRPRRAGDAQAQDGGGAAVDDAAGGLEDFAEPAGTGQARQAEALARDAAADLGRPPALLELGGEAAARLRRDLAQFVRTVLAGGGQDMKGWPFRLGPLSEAGARLLARLFADSRLGGKGGVVDVAGFEHTVNADEILHAWKRHGGANETDPRNVPLAPEDLERLPDVLAAPTTVGVQAGTRRMPPSVIYRKEVGDGTLVVVVEHAQAKAKRLSFRTMYKLKGGGEEGGRRASIPEGPEARRPEPGSLPERADAASGESVPPAEASINVAEAFVGADFEEFRRALPKDASGDPDVIVAGARIIRDVAGAGLPWTKLSAAQRREAIARAKGRAADDGASAAQIGRDKDVHFEIVESGDIMQVAIFHHRVQSGVAEIADGKVRGVEWDPDFDDAVAEANAIQLLEQQFGGSPRPPSRAVDDGGQAVLPGAERISDRALAERRGAAPLRAAVAQKAADDGLFDVAGRGQADLLDAVPVGERIDANGVRVAEVRGAADLLEEVEADREFLEQLDLCVGRAAR